MFEIKDDRRLSSVARARVCVSQNQLAFDSLEPSREFRVHVVIIIITQTVLTFIREHDYARMRI